MGTNFPFASIGAMPPMTFWVRGVEHLPTLSSDDVESALGKSPAEIPEDQRMRVQAAAAEAQSRLLNAEVGEPYCRKPS